MDERTRSDLIDYLNGFVTENKRRRFDEVLPNRTRHVAVVLEDIYQPHNASATIRSCDLFGVQDLHVIENRNRYTLSPGVAVGASKWITLHRYNKRGENNTPMCLDRLRERGYRIVATTPHKDEVLLPDLPVEKPFAMVFGTEETGLSPEMLDSADEYVKIPMYGFTESFNISVSVALALYDVTRRLHRSNVDWQLSEEELIELRLEWLRKVLSRHKGLEERFFEGR